eukprot:PhM_4_TR17303/c0_g1_i1/m.39672
MIQELLEAQRQTVKAATSTMHQPHRPLSAKDVTTSNLDVQGIMRTPEKQPKPPVDGTPSSRRPLPSRTFEEAYEAAPIDNAQEARVCGHEVEYHTLLQGGVNQTLWEAVERREKALQRKHRRFNRAVGAVREEVERMERMLEFDMGYQAATHPVIPEDDALKDVSLKVDPMTINELNKLENIDMSRVRDIALDLRSFEPIDSRRLDRFDETLKGADRISHAELSVIFRGLHALGCRDVLAVVRGDLEESDVEVTRLVREVEVEDTATRYAEDRKDYSRAEHHMFQRSQLRRDLLNLIHTRLEQLRLCNDEVRAFLEERETMVIDSRRVLDQLRRDKTLLNSHLEDDNTTLHKHIASLRESIETRDTEYRSHLETTDLELRHNAEEQKSCFEQIAVLMQRANTLLRKREDIVEGRVDFKEKTALHRANCEATISTLDTYLGKLGTVREMTLTALALGNVANDFAAAAEEHFERTDVLGTLEALIEDENRHHYNEYDTFVNNVGLLISKLEVRRDLLTRQERSFMFDVQVAKELLDPQHAHYVTELKRVTAQKEEADVKLGVLETVRTDATTEFDITFKEMSNRAIALDEDALEHPYTTWRARYADEHENVVVATQKFVEKEQLELEVESTAIRKALNAAQVQKGLDKTRPPTDGTRLMAAERKGTEQAT